MVPTATILGYIGNVALGSLFLAPISTVLEITRKGSSGTFSSLPFFLTLRSCLLSAWYGLPFISEGLFWGVTPIKSVGVLAELIYISIFIRFAGNQKKKLIVCLVIIAVLFGGVALISSLVVPMLQRSLVCGICVAIVSACLNCLPVLGIVGIVRTKSLPSSTPLLFSCAAIFCACSWLAYGVASKNLYVLVPNVVGCLLWFCVCICESCQEAGKEQSG